MATDRLNSEGAVQPVLFPVEPALTERGRGGAHGSGGGPHGLLGPKHTLLRRRHGGVSRPTHDGADISASVARGFAIPRHSRRVHSKAEQLHSLADSAPVGLQAVTIPDLWQQQAVGHLRAGRDVVVSAPTGAGKTLIFELWSQQGKNRQQAIYTVPTRALANDKLAEWRARGWNVGIATGDLAENLNAPILVATLETQKQRLIEGDGPALLVVDEYQMLADPDRGLNYELAMALAPPGTQLLLLSGSVANPHHLVQWLTRLGRRASLVKYDVRPVPLDEVVVAQLSYRLPTEIRGYWPRIAAKALAEDLGPILLFAPRRAHAEELAAELARNLPIPNPLTLSEAQKRLVGEHLAKLLKARVAYHHSGLSYAIRAGVIEPLAKAGQLRAVVATMGLAAGINFSLRSVAITAADYKRDGQVVPLKADEIHQMFGRAGRRGLDESGFVLVTANELRIRDGHPVQLARSGMVDWSALLSLMAAAAAAGRDPYREAVRVQERLFTTKPIFLGVEASLKNPETPCGLRTDSERARHVRQRVREMQNSAGQWEAYPFWHDRRLGEIFTTFRPPALPAVESPRVRGDAAVISPPMVVPSAGTAAVVFAAPPADTLRPVLTEPAALDKVGIGGLTVVEESAHGRIWGRSLVVAERLGDDRVLLAKPMRRLVGWHGREATLATFEQEILPVITGKLREQRTPVVRYERHPTKLIALVSLAEQVIKVPVDHLGVPLWKPVEREVFPADCAVCPHVALCKELPTTTGTALLWRRLELVDSNGVPTRRGRVVSFFSGGDGLAVAAALEDATYPLDELIYDLANLDAGFRFCGDDNRWGGRLALACHQKYALQSITGYLENGLPPKYGDGANTVVRVIQKDPFAKHRFVTDFLGAGDIDRIVIEWRSLLRSVANAPKLEWARWTEFQALAKATLQTTESPTETDLPPLELHQTKRVDHRLKLRR